MDHSLENILINVDFASGLLGQARIRIIRIRKESHLLLTGVLWSVFIRDIQILSSLCYQKLIGKNIMSLLHI
jgi:hypothetical protein